MFSTLDRQMNKEGIGIELCACIPSMAFALIRGRVIMARQLDQFSPWFILEENEDKELTYFQLRKEWGEWMREDIA